jgi:hypothetical protein
MNKPEKTWLELSDTGRQDQSLIGLIMPVPNLKEGELFLNNIFIEIYKLL